MNPVEDFYVDIDMHFKTIKQFLLERDITGSMAGQLSYSTSQGRVLAHDGVADQQVMQFNLDVVDEDDMTSNSDLLVPTQQSVKAYVDALETALASTLNGEGASKIGVEDVAGNYTGTDLETVLGEIGTALSGISDAIDIQGDIDCSTNPNYPAASKGHAYYVTVAGKIGGASGKTVNVGDLIIAKAANAGGDEVTVGADWFVLESNRDQATETVLGVAKIATQVLTDGGTNDTDIVTPLKMKTRLQNIGTVVQEKQAVTGSASAAVSAVTPGAGGTIQATGDITANLEAGCVIQVTGSTNNDGFYTVVSATLNATNTDIVVQETVGPVADGNVVYGLKNTITLANIDVDGDDAHHQVHDTTNRQEVFPYVYYDGTTDVVVWFRSPASGSHEVIVQGLFANW